jgi:hypothetical protein
MFRRGGFVQRRFAESIFDINISFLFEKQPAISRIRYEWYFSLNELVTCREINYETLKPSVADVNIFRRYSFAG